MGRCPFAITLAALIVIILLGDSWGFNKPQEPPFYGDVRVSVAIENIEESTTSGRIALGEVREVNGSDIDPFKIRIHFLNDYPEIVQGQTVCFKSEIKRLQPPPDIPDAVDFQKELRRRGITATAVVLSDSITSVSNTRGPIALLQRMNAAAMERLRSSHLSETSVNLLSAMLLGKDEYIPDEERENFSASGLSHLLALSGTHVAVIVMIISLMLWPLYFGRHRRAHILLTLLALWTYAAFTGFTPSVTRAVIMATVFLCSRLWQRHFVPLNSLCLAACLILLFSPRDLYSLGFQMSFAAVAGIIIFFPLINRVDRRNHPYLYAIVSVPALSLSAMVFTGILSAFYFHSFPVYFIISNVLMVLIVPLFIISGVVSLVLNAVGPTDSLASLISGCAHTVASLPGATLSGIYPSAMFTGLFILLTFLFGFAIHLKKRFFAMEALVLLAGVTAMEALDPRKDNVAAEDFVVSDSRSVSLISRRGSQCTLYTTARVESERREAQALYSRMLAEYMAKRGVDSLALAPKGAAPTYEIKGRTYVAVLDSCTPGRIACRVLE